MSGTRPIDGLARGACALVAGILAVVGLYLVVNAYFIFSVNTKTGEGWDGLGRPLSATPPIISSVYGKMWAGWGWFLVDDFVGIVLAGIVYTFGNFAVKGEWPKNDPPTT